MTEDRGVRERLRGDLEERYDKLLGMLDDGLAAEKSWRDDTPCPKQGCNCKHIRYITVPDYATKLKIAEFMANQGLGRPDVAQQEEQDRIVFVREVRK